MKELVAVVLFGGVVAYCIFAGADFGAGFWDLTAGGPARGARPRALIDAAIGPVWEANHVWLIFCLVVLWTAFPLAFAAIMSTLHIPLGLAAFGIVMRGSGFAFRRVSVRLAERQVNGAAFALSSVVTPFFLGTVAGGIASGRVPTDGRGDAIASWLNPTSVLGGVLAVVTCAYLAAVFLTVDAANRGSAELEIWFRRRAVVAAGVAGVAVLIGVFVLRADSERLLDRLLGPGLPLVLVAGTAGLGALWCLHADRVQAARSLAVTAVVSVVTGWGVAQYPQMLGTHLRIADAASPRPTLISIIAIAAGAVMLCGPGMVWLYFLQQRAQLDEP
jgi:cytochrome d ubiquinol oxidase subunit II